jgi:hypothetical protein
MSKLSYVLVCALAITSGCSTPVESRWTEQGPKPLLDGQVAGLPGNPVSGAINAIAIDHKHPGTVYLATVNGGVWKSKDVNAASPHWAPLTDLKLPALSINSIAISPLKSSVIFAGTGSTSSDGLEGSSGFGVIRSTNGGETWSILAGATFTGRRINSIVPTTITTGALEGQVVLAATLFDRGGVYRSTNGGTSFTRVSGSAGLPNGGVSNLVADPTNPMRFYAGVPSFFGGLAAAGVYRSDDGGVTWNLVATGMTGQGTTRRILLSVGRSTGIVYAMLINSSDKLGGLFRSANAGANWSPIVPPPMDIFPGAQGILHGAIAADPVAPAIVYVAGDRQALPFPNANGCDNFVANMYRGDIAAATVWKSVVCNGAQGTAPHADARSMMFDDNGNLLQTNDGGFNRLDNPGLPTRHWVSLNGDVAPTEVHSATFDGVSKVLVGGSQDTGTVIQSTPGNQTFTNFIQGDGGVVAVDDKTGGPALSIRYTSFAFLVDFNRTIWNAANVLLSGPTLAGLRIVSGPGTGLDLFMFDPNIQFYNPYELNRIDPTRMLIGTANIYESFDGGDTLANRFPAGDFITSLSYGGRLAGVPNPGAFYVGATGVGPGRVFYRASDTSPIHALATYPGAGVVDLVMDPNNTHSVFVADLLGHVWTSQDEGATWQDLTANLPRRITELRTIELFSPDASGHHNVLFVGGIGGIFEMRYPFRPSSVWERTGRNLPHGNVLDLRYHDKAKLLVAGILGRGIWTLDRFGGQGGWKHPVAEGKNRAAITTTMPANLPASAPVSRSLVRPAVAPTKQ